MVLQDILSIITAAGGKLIFAVIAYFVGKMIVDTILQTVKKLKALEKIEPTARTFILSSLRMALYVLLIVTIIYFILAWLLGKALDLCVKKKG